MSTSQSDPASLDAATLYPGKTPALYRGNKKLRQDPDVDASIGLHDMRSYPSAETTERQLSRNRRQNAMHGKKYTDSNDNNDLSFYRPEFHVYSDRTGGRRCALLRATQKLQEARVWQDLASVEEFRIDDEEGDLKVIPTEIKKLKALRILTIRWSPLKFIGPDVSHLELTQLFLERNQLRNIDPVCKIKSLTILNLAANMLEVLPEEISDLSYLRELDVSGNKLRQLPKSIGWLGLLKCLTASSNKLVSLPGSIGKLGEVVMLDVSGNLLRDLPEEIGSMKSLEYLIASHNQIETLPNSMGQCPNLQSVSLRDNELKDVPAVLSQIQKLEVLNLRENYIESMDDAIKTLKCLILDLNNFEEIPEAVLSCSELELLSMIGNEVGVIPFEIQKLEKLRRLYLNANNITEIPIALVELKELRHLLLELNNIPTIPPQIHNLKKLTDLRLDKGKLHPKWASVYGKGIEALQNFAARLDRGSVVLASVKKDSNQDSGLGSIEGAQEMDSSSPKRLTKEKVVNGSEDGNTKLDSISEI